MTDPKPIERWRIVSDHLTLMDRPAPSLAGDWVRYEDHRARVEELEAQARELNRGMAMLCSAMRGRSYEEIRTTFGGNTPELWCATADELCGLLTRVEELELERDRLRTGSTRTGHAPGVASMSVDQEQDKGGHDGEAEAAAGR